jgi:hypothetical protein
MEQIDGYYLKPEAGKNPPSICNYSKQKHIVLKNAVSMVFVSQRHVRSHGVKVYSRA